MYTYPAQFGIQTTDVVFVLNTRQAVKAFSHGNVMLGANISIAVGPTGRSSEAAGGKFFSDVALVHTAPVYSYSKSKGLFVGVTLEGTMVMTRKRTNARFYGVGVTAADILSGRIPAPPVAEPLYRSMVWVDVVLNIKFGHLPHDSGGSMNTLNDPRIENRVRDSIESPPVSMSDHSQTLKICPPKPPLLPFASSNPAVSKSAPPKPPKVTKPARSTALYDYTGPEGDLSFRRGDVIWVTSTNGEWREGTFGGRKGLFPGSYVIEG